MLNSDGSVFGGSEKPGYNGPNFTWPPASPSAGKARMPGNKNFLPGQCFLERDQLMDDGQVPGSEKTRIDSICLMRTQDA